MPGAGAAFLQGVKLFRRRISCTCGTRTAWAGSRARCAPLEKKPVGVTPLFFRSPIDASHPSMFCRPPGTRDLIWSSVCARRDELPYARRFRKRAPMRVVCRRAAAMAAPG